MEFSDIVHGVLDVAGFIPAVGVVADVANAAVYAAEGDWANAALSAVSAIPVVGDAAAVAGKSVKVVSKISKGSEKALSKAKKMKSSFAAKKGKAKTGAKKKKLNRKRKARKQKKAAKKKCTNGKCFTGDMLVYTEQGLCPIKEIRKGDDIYSRNMQTGETGIRKVEEVFQTEAHTIHHIWLDGKEELKTTAYHPIFVKERGWVSAINLREGDLLETLEGMAQVTKTEKVRHEEPVEVFNFHVEEWESYFVSGRQVYVHNGHDHENGTSSGALEERGINSLDDLLTNPDKLSGVSPEELHSYLKNNHYDVKSLRQGSLKGIPFDKGGGFKVNWGGDRILQYHPEAGSHHGGAYYKLSSGETGTFRIDLNGNRIH